MFEPLFSKEKRLKSSYIHGVVPEINFQTPKTTNKIAITVDFSTSDHKAINKAIELGGKSATFLLIHVLESTNAVMYGEHTTDSEREEDTKNLEAYKQQMLQQGYQCEYSLGFGRPKVIIPNLVKECDVLVMGTHGHKTFKDILFGTTVESVRHRINIPLVLV